MLNSEYGILSPWVKDGWRIEWEELDVCALNLHWEGIVSRGDTVTYGESSPGLDGEWLATTV